MAGLRERRGGGGTVTGELRGEGDGSASGRRLPRGCFRPRRRPTSSQLAAPGARQAPGWEERARGAVRSASPRPGTVKWAAEGARGERRGR